MQRSPVIWSEPNQSPISSAVSGPGHASLDSDVNSIGEGGKPSLDAMKQVVSLVGGEAEKL